MRGDIAEDGGFERSRSGTVYWTISLYIDAEKIASLLKMNIKAGEFVPPDLFQKAQISHLPSLALANAIDPLLNDIADRETQGQVQEFLLSAKTDPCSTIEQAAAIVRAFEELIIELPSEISWVTEGIHFRACPPDLAAPRKVRLRCFWMSHNNGAMSFHLSFSHFYASYCDEDGLEQSGYDPATYYFLSTLQKIAAPKEYALSPERLNTLIHQDTPYVDVFASEPLGISPLDDVQVTNSQGEKNKFWPFIRSCFEAEAAALFGRLGEQLPTYAPPKEGFANSLLELVPFIEVPGLKVPKSRFMFMLHDARFFDRLMPLDAETLENAPRKVMVQNPCYEPYQAKIVQKLQEANAASVSEVYLDADFWLWTKERDDYENALRDGVFALVSATPANPSGRARAAPKPFKGSMEDLAEAIRAGRALLLKDFNTKLALAEPQPICIPAFEARRTDCMDYLFLSGFNQNIIDFMNQDTSEILDSIDPIYPDHEEQADERFFVRYANHRAMISYVPKSRSLETGNDYIGTCPYAFLIHAYALHNEFLARSHENKSMARIDRIESLLSGSPPRNTIAVDQLNWLEPLEAGDADAQAESAINLAKIAVYGEYERFRYDNPFRYDTERNVFETLEELRGTKRKIDSLGLAIHNLEDLARDINRRHQNASADETARRDRHLNILLGGTGVFGAGQMFYWIGEKSAGEGPEGDYHVVSDLVNSLLQTNNAGISILAFTEVFMLLALMLFVPFLLWLFFDFLRLKFRVWRGKSK